MRIAGAGASEPNGGDSPTAGVGGAARQAAPPPQIVVVGKRVGHVDTGDVCGFSDAEDWPICGRAPTLHGLFIGTWEEHSTGFACERHADALRRVADMSHEAALHCFDFDSCDWSAP